MTDNGREADDFSVPNGWQVAPLGKFGDFKSGNGFPLRYQGGQSGEIPFYKVSDMSSEGNSMLMTNANHWIDEGTRRVLGAHIMPPNAIIFAKIGAAIFLERRRLLSMNSCIDNNVMAFVPSETDANPLFFYYLLQSVPFGPLVAATALPSLSGKAIGALSFCFPPRHEQETIATALKDIDDLIASLDALIAKKRDIKLAAMQQLLTGKTRLPGFEGEWQVAKLGEIAKIQRGASPRPIDSPRWFDDNSSIGWVRISDVTRSGIKLTETTQRLSAAGVQHSRFVPNGSLIMSICATIGRPIITNLDVCIHDGFVVFDELKVEKDFLYFVLKNVEGEWSKMGQTGSQMNLNTGMINGKEITVPVDRDEQAAIARIAFDMEAEMGLLHDKGMKARALKQGMMQQLLTGQIRLV